MRFLLSILLLTLAACQRDRGPDPQLKFELYDLGWQRGFNDQLIPNKPDWQRFRGVIDEYKTVVDRDALFSTGYADGYHQHPEVPRDEDELTYDFAFRHGRCDAWAGKPSASTANAYLDGYEQRPHRFTRPY
jgi:hypothetical protein